MLKGIDDFRGRDDALDVPEVLRTNSAKYCSFSLEPFEHLVDGVHIVIGVRTAARPVTRSSDSATDAAALGGYVKVAYWCTHADQRIARVGVAGWSGAEHPM